MAEPIKKYITRDVCGAYPVTADCVAVSPTPVPIPAGRSVNFSKMVSNGHGEWAHISFQGSSYLVRPSDLVIKVQDVIKHSGPKPGIMAHRKKEDIKLIGQIPLWNENLRPIYSHCWLACNSVNELIQIQESECEYYFTMGEEHEEFLQFHPIDRRKDIR